MTHVSGVSEQHTGSRRVASVATISLERTSAGLIVCDVEGRVLGGSRAGRDLIARAGIDLQILPAPLTTAFWELLLSHEVGASVQWRPGAEREVTLSCTRHHLGDDWLLILNEVSLQQSQLAYRLHQQRLESLGRVVAAAVHDLRAPLSSIVFGIDVLATRAAHLTNERGREIIQDVRTAAFCLHETIDCLLDYLRLGPPVPSAVSIQNVLLRTQSLLRPQLRMGPHELALVVEHAVSVRGNLITIEQIFVNLVINSLEAAAGPTKVQISTSLAGSRLRVLVEDDGPGIRAEQRQLVFEPMFTTKQNGVGLGLTSARDAARAVGGDIELVRWVGGTAFAVLLPICAAEEGP